MAPSNRLEADVVALNGRARTAETYLAGLGATGALIAGAVVVFLLLVGMVIFDAWPRAAGLFGGEEPEVEAVDANSPADAAAEALGGVSDLVASARPGDSLVGSPPGDGSGVGGGGGNAPSGSDIGAGGYPGGGAGTTETAGGGSTGGGGDIQDTVGGVGETVDNTVSGAGETVDNTVSGVGDTVDDTVNGLNSLLNGQE